MLLNEINAICTEMSVTGGSVLDVWRMEMCDIECSKRSAVRQRWRTTMITSANCEKVSKSIMRKCDRFVSKK
jgi:hypothetical protein